jgi:multidrug efflux pump subunit AcrA (membrane-fusion protein)
VIRALLIALVATSCGRSSEVASATPGVRTEKLIRGELVDRVLLTGDLRAGSSVELSVPKTDSWQLTIRWMAEDATLVKAGDKVLEFDNATFVSGLEQKRIAASEAASSYRSLRDISALATAVKEHELAQFKIALEKANLLASVPADLLPQRTVQERLLEKSRADTAVAKAESELAAERRAAVLESKVKEIELEKAKRAVESAERSISELVLTAPRDGLLLLGEHPWESRPYRVGDMVQPGMRLLSMPDVSEPMLVRAELSDVDDGRVTLGMTGTCTLDAYPREPLDCKVIELAPVAGNRNRESLRRAFSVTLGLAKTDQARMRPGMSVQIDLRGPSAPGLLLAPRGAILFEDPPKLRVSGGGLRAVTLGACDARRCVIEQGAAEGDVAQVNAMTGAP